MTSLVEKNEQGYVALLSVVLISAVLLILTAAVAGGIAETRFNVLRAEDKKISRSLAESCIQTAVLNLAKDRNYGVTVPASGFAVAVDGALTCRICSVAGGGPYSVVARAVHNGAYTNLAADVQFLSPYSGEYAIQRWEEFISYSGGCSLP